MSNALERRAQKWVEDIHPHAPHLVRARDWVVRLDPDARTELRIAAVLHDIERAFPDPDADWDPAQAWDDPAYLRWHQDRSADFAVRWLLDQDADHVTIGAIDKLIRVHEDGGWPEADILQAADSLSFFETVVGVTIKWVQDGAAPERARDKLQYMAHRVTADVARADVDRLLVSSLAELEAAIAEPSRS